ncbi:redox-regulated ATPase YchF [Magnetococcales bacterium HHB-1]
MGLQCGIVGLPNVGKSTIFNALTAAGAEMANYPFCTIEPNLGMVTVPDPRLDKLADIVKPQKVVPTFMEFVDIAGLVEGASKGEGLGNQFLGHIRQVDAITHVVRCFEDSNITHVSNKIDPKADIGIIDMELILADLASVEKRHASVTKKARSGEKEAKIFDELYQRVIDGLNEGIPVRRQQLSDDDKENLKDLFLLTAKPVLYVCNVSEEELSEEGEKRNPHIQAVRKIAQQEQAGVVIICGSIEAEISELDEEEKGPFLEDLGLEEPGLNRLIRHAFRLLGLRTYFTAGEKEVRAWNFIEGATAPEAAGVIHTDFQRGFIRAEVIDYPTFIDCHGEQGAKQQGKMRSEGKSYIVQDGDVIHFLFNV